MLEGEQKKPKGNPSRRYAPVDIDRIQHKFLQVLHREANRLLDLSWKEQLSEIASKSLVNYLKLLKDLQEQELAALDVLTDEQLEAHAKTNTKQGE